MKKLILSMLVIAIAIILAGSVTAQDCCGWRGNERDGKVSGFVKPVVWPAQLTKVWQSNAGLGDASPVMADGKLFLHVKQDSSEVMLCMDAATGKEIWHTNLNPSPNINGPAMGHPGPRSTPFYAKDKLYSLGTGGVVSCLDAKTGKIIWKNEAFTGEVPQFYTASSPLVVEDKCIMQLGGREHGCVVAFDALTGHEMWRVEGQPSTYSSPILSPNDKQMLLVQSETDLLGISTNGTLLWKIPTPTQRMFNNAVTPVAHGMDVIVTGQGSGTKMVHLQKEADQWINNLLWDNNELGVSFNTPLVKNGYLYGNEAKSGNLFCLDVKTGEKKWMDATALNRFASLQDLGEVVACLPSTGQLIFFSPSQTVYTELAKYKVADTEVYAHPLIAGDRIYVKDKESLTCWSLK
ncbi:MAG TPA: PQQ-binding-like beta-propeller repeat protein [Prolixibacteraceae bacterium]|nr:PQQ-binding-like beta-propeller repeat protein [Prolixibacteraceae bacterium]